MSEIKRPQPPRQLPALEPDSAFYWTDGSEGRLKIARCESCGRYLHPPLPYCATCGSTEIGHVAVSGRARVASYTINEQPWVPGLEVPYVFAAVELVEQPELYVFTNIVGCPVEDVRIGMEVEVLFEQLGEVYFPLFQPVVKRHA